MVAVIDTKRKPLIVFSAINVSHPFYMQVSEFEQRILCSPAHAVAMQRQQQNLPVAIHAEIKTKATGTSRWVERFYYSIQYPDNSKPGGWYGWTLYFTEGDAAPAVYEFPDEPKLTHLAKFINAPEHRNIQVLRYVPLRRVTFIKPCGSQQPALIGKLKKPKRCLQGYDRLNEINAIALQGKCTIPQAVSIDQNFSVFYQSLMPGQEITHAFTDENYLTLMADLGHLHADLSKWPMPVNQYWDRGGISLNLDNDIAEIKFYLPQSTPLMDTLSDWLSRAKPNIKTMQSFCHGDFACPQILRDGNNWSVVDFDLAGYGDTYQDMAMFMASLSYDVPFFKAKPSLLRSAQQAYVNAYIQTSNNPVDEYTLRWYMVCAEIYYLALNFKKNLYAPQTYKQAQTRLENLINSNI